MSLGLMFILLLVAIVVICVVASKVYPALSGQTTVQAEQDITGIGPETNLAADPDDKTLG